MNLSNLRASAVGAITVASVSLLPLCAIPAAAQQSSASARDTTFTSRTGGLLRVLTIRSANAGRISGTISQRNAVFQLRGRRDTNNAANRYTGTVATEDAPNVVQNFELRRSGNLAIFSFLRPGSQTQTDLSTRTVFRPSTVNAAQQGQDDSYADDEEYNSGGNGRDFDNRDTQADDRDFIEPPGPTPSDDGEFIGTFRGSRSTLTLREGREPRTYTGTLRQGNRSFPVTVRRMPRVVGSYLDSTGRRRTFSAMSPGQNRIVIEMNGETESLRRAGDVYTDEAFDSSADDDSNSGQRRNNDGYNEDGVDFADTPAYEDDENSITPRGGAVRRRGTTTTPQQRYLNERANGATGRAGTNRRNNADDDLIESDGSLRATLPQQGRSTAPLNGRPAVQPARRYDNRSTAARRTSNVASANRSRISSSDGKPLGRNVDD